MRIRRRFLNVLATNLDLVLLPLRERYIFDPVPPIQLYRVKGQACPKDMGSLEVLGSVTNGSFVQETENLDVVPLEGSLESLKTQPHDMLVLLTHEDGSSFFFFF